MKNLAFSRDLPQHIQQKLTAVLSDSSVIPGETVQEMMSSMDKKLVI